jgi:predicted permease
MPDWRQEIHERLQASETSPEIEHDLVEEIAQDLEQRYQDAVASGTPADAAAARLREQLAGGWLERRAKELSQRDARRRPEPPSGDASWWSVLLYDIRFALRGLRLSKSFTAAALVSLALGIGATTTIFQLLNAVRMRSLPISHPEELMEVRIVNMNGMSGSFYVGRPAVSHPIWEQIQKQQQVLDGLFAWYPDQYNIADAGEAKNVPGLEVSGNFFSTLGVKPVLGRLIVPSDDVPGCAPVVVISEGLWQQRYGGAQEVIGKTLPLERTPFEIIGVAPKEFFGLEVGQRFDVAAPLCTEPKLMGEMNRLNSGRDWWLTVMGRLKPGVTMEKASAQLDSISAAVFEATVPTKYPPDKIGAYKSTKLGAYPAGTGVSLLRRDYTTSLWLLFGIAAFVMLIACANLANLLLARASAREREFAIRLALGASRERILRQLMTESALLAFAGAVLGLLISVGLSRGMVAFLQTKANPIFLDITPDYRVLGFTIGAACLTCLLFGLAPALRASGTSPGAALKSVGRTMVSGSRGFTLRRALVAVQVALSAVLVIAALLFTQSLRNLLNVDVGFEQRGLVVAGLDMSALHIPMEQRIAFKKEILDRVAHMPGIEGATFSFIRPLGGGGWNNDIWMEENGKSSAKETWVNSVGPSYFATIGIPVVGGRSFSDADTQSSAPVAMVNETFVRKVANGANPIGKTLVIEPSPGSPARRFQIVGVTKDTKYRSLKEEVMPQMFVSAWQDEKPSAGMRMLVRTRISTAETFREINSVLAGIAPQATIYYAVLREQVEDSLLRERMMATLSLFFGMLATVLAVVGLYGVISYSVARRTNEIGVRVALGATRSRIMKMILSEGGTLIIAGLVVGVITAIALGRLATAMLFGLTPGDPRVLVGASLLLFVAGLLATAIPAMRAANLNPMAALREE